MTSDSRDASGSDLERALTEHRQRLDAQEARVLGELRARYAEVIERLRTELELLATAIRAAQEAGEELSVSWLHRQARYQRLLEQAGAEFARFTAAGERTLSAAHEAFAQAGTTAATGLIQAAGLSAGFEARLNTVALERLVGALQSSSPLRGVLDSYGQHAAAVIERRLVEGITIGEGARAIVWQIQDELGGALPQARLASLVRTEGMRAYRAAQIETYRQMSDSVGGWRWSAAHSPRTCAACLANDDGHVYPLSMPMDKPHVACRCVPIPVPIGMALTSPETGGAWLARQSPEVQRQVLGSRRAVEAYRRGEVALSDFVGERHDPRWGTSIYQKSWRQVSQAGRSGPSGTPIPGEHGIERTLEELREATGGDVVRIGKVRRDAVAHWSERMVTEDIVITAERRRHYLSRHPEIEQFEGLIIETLLDPDEVFVYSADPESVANFRRSLDDRNDLLVGLWISDDPTKQNSLHSARISRKRNQASMRRKGLSVWMK